MYKRQAVGMLRVRAGGGKLYADDDHYGTDHVGGGVYSVGDHGAGVGRYAGEKFGRGKDHVPDNRDNGYPVGDAAELIAGGLARQRAEAVIVSEMCIRDSPRSTPPGPRWRWC